METFRACCLDVLNNVIPSWEDVAQLSDNDQRTIGGLVLGLNDPMVAHAYLTSAVGEWDWAHSMLDGYRFPFSMPEEHIKDIMLFNHPDHMKRMLSKVYWATAAEGRVELIDLAVQETSVRNLRTFFPISDKLIRVWQAGMEENNSLVAGTAWKELQSMLYEQEDLPEMDFMLAMANDAFQNAPRVAELAVQVVKDLRPYTEHLLASHCPHVLAQLEKEEMLNVVGDTPPSKPKIM